VTVAVVVVVAVAVAVAVIGWQLAEGIGCCAVVALLADGWRRSGSE
jgi:hypothetical protein